MASAAGQGYKNQPAREGGLVVFKGGKEEGAKSEVGFNWEKAGLARFGEIKAA
ncbi:MAG: hypothetical protein JWM59_4862 [Verrucomicrobiales bacterium]|nr:hypothetical protein [Verrucomicrobiales bacterium]